MKRTGFLAIALATAVTVGCNADKKDVGAGAPAGGAAPVGTAGTDSVKSGDKDFVHDVAIGGAAEVELGKLAVERGANPEVKKFGQMMVDDHTKAGNELAAIASRNNIPAPAELDDKHRDLRDKLAKLQGADFDREYIDAMVDDHNEDLDKLGSRVDKKTLDEYKAQVADRESGKKVKEDVKAVTIVPETSDNAVTTSINQWAANAYPVVQGHLEAAKTIQKSIKKRMTD